MKQGIKVSVFIIIFFIFKSTLSEKGQRRAERPEFGPSLSVFPRSPFHPPDENGKTINYDENHLQDSNSKPSVPVKSPFSPPYDPQDLKTGVNVAPASNKKKNTLQSRSQSTGRSSPRRTPPNVPSPSRNVHQNQRNSARNRKTATSHDKSNSPFLPQVGEFKEPGDSQSSKPALENSRPSSSQRRPAYRQAMKGSKRKTSSEFQLIIERQRENTRQIPAISSIQVKPGQYRRRQDQQPPPPSAHSQSSVVKVEGSGQRPRHSSYRSRVLRDIHDVAPGVTPWTRYTSRPRNGGRRQQAHNTSSYRGRCGDKQYSPRSQICCQGSVLRRQGIQPSCCGPNTYDAVFKTCCHGDIVTLSTQGPDC